MRTACPGRLVDPARARSLVLGAASVLGLAFLPGAAGHLVAQSRKLDLEVSRALEREGAACACVLLEDSSRAGDPLRRRAEAFRKTQDAFLESLPAGSARLRYRYRYSPVVVLDVADPAALKAIEASPHVRKGGADAMGSGGLHQSRALIGANDVFNLGITGAGRVAAVLDTGVDTDHADLEEAVIYQRHFLSGGANVGPGAEDGHGHGTNVCGIIASRGLVAPRGVAPGASLVAIKVLDDSNRGFLSDWAAGVEHAVDLDADPAGIPIDAINMSLVSDAPFAGPCDASFVAFANACRAALEAGIAVFASSGNTGSTSMMTAPACLSAVISVGSVPDNLPDRISSFTSRTADLDLLAPGEPITSTGRSGGSSTFSGTSQACPHAVAAACLLREVSPAMAPAVIEAVLEETGVSVSDTGQGRSFPRIDVKAAVEAARKPGDCNANGLSDWIDIHITETSADGNQDGVPDECDPPPPEPEFRRGDPNLSGDVDISDAVKTLLFLFGGDSLSCRKAADANDSGDVDISDAIFLLDSLFKDGTPIPPPGGDLCGADPTADPLTCEEYPGCN